MGQVLYVVGFLILTLGAINLIRMAIFIIGAELYDLKKLRNEKTPRKYKFPKVTVIVPAYNEEAVIVRTLESVLALNYPSFQVVVVDDGSRDKTFELASGLAKSKSVSESKLLVLSKTNGGKAAAMNYALEFADDSELVMCLDADSVIDKGALKKGAKHFQRDPKLVALAANVRIIDDGTVLGLLQKFE